MASPPNKRPTAAERGRYAANGAVTGFETIPAEGIMPNVDALIQP